MIGIAEGHDDKRKAAGHQQVEPMVGQPVGLGDMLEQVAAERCPGVKRPEADHVVVISQIGLNIAVSRALKKRATMPQARIARKERAHELAVARVENHARPGAAGERELAAQPLPSPCSP